MKRYFFLESSPTHIGKCLIKLDLEKYPLRTSGSLNVWVARLLGLSYPDYLRYARDRLGATLVGKGHRYVTPFFEDNPTTQQLVKLLNMRMNYIIDEKENPFEYKRGEDGKVVAIPFEEKDDNG